jgi:hypothetical protein
LPRWLGPTNGRDPRSLEPGHRAGAGLPTTDSVCRVHARGLLLDCSASHILDTTMINSFLMISTAVRAEHAPSRSIGNCMSSVRAPSLKVSRSMPHNSRTLRTLMCGCACHHAFLARGLLLCAAGAPPFSGVGISRAPLTRLSLCSQTTSEVAGRLVLAAKEGPERERRHRSASVRAGCDIVDLVVCRTVREAVVQPLGWYRGHMGPAKRALSRSRVPMEWVWARQQCLVK